MGAYREARMPGRSSLPCADCVVNLSAMPGIHVLAAVEQEKRGWPGRSPAMTKEQIIFHVVRKSLKMLEAFFGQALGRRAELSVRIDDEFVRDAGVEVFVAFRRLLKVDHLDIDDLGDRQSVPKYRLHELPVVFQDRCLAGMEAVGLCPAETEAQAEVAMFGCLLLRAGIIGHIQAGNADRTGRPGDLHQAIEHDSRRFDDFASKPTQSIAQSTSGTPRTSSTNSPRRSCLVRSIGSKPTFLAWASRS